MSLNSAKIKPLNIEPISPVRVKNADLYNSREGRRKKLQHLYVLPVLLLEFLALAITRAVIPSLLLEVYGDNVYFIMGCAECIRGLLAFIACPLFGKVSDVVGRKACLFITVLGTCSPACSLALMSWYNPHSWHDFQSSGYGVGYNEAGADKTAGTGISPLDEVSTNTDSITPDEGVIEQHIWIFVILLACSGIFSSTFTLTFAYISDTVRNKKDRVSAYGLALATFGLSFTIGPMLGGYLAKTEDIDSVGNGHEESFHSPYPLGQRRVFILSFMLTILDLCYIYFILPESNTSASNILSPTRARINRSFDEYDDEDDDCSNVTVDSRATISDQWNQIRHNVMPKSWSPLDTMKVFASDPFMHEVAWIAFFYYTSLWAVVSTLVLYAAKRFQLTPERLGELMSALGLCTMISEAVLVRIVVPSIGEKRSMRLGLIAFTLQCIVLGFAYESWQLFICVLLSILGNLVYPSLSSLVSNSVQQDMVGEALGAINGVKALTEGVGPLFFGILMSLSERSLLPGWPYLIAAVFSYVAYKRSSLLPDENDEDYISEKYHRKEDCEGEEEYAGLLSEIDEMSEDDVIRDNKVLQEKCTQP